MQANAIAAADAAMGGGGSAHSRSRVVLFLAVAVAVAVFGSYGAGLVVSYFRSGSKARNVPAKPMFGGTLSDADLNLIRDAFMNLDGAAETELVLRARELCMQLDSSDDDLNAPLNALGSKRSPSRAAAAVLLRGVIEKPEYAASLADPLLKRIVAGLPTESNPATKTLIVSMLPVLILQDSVVAQLLKESDTVKLLVQLAFKPAVDAPALRFHAWNSTMLLLQRAPPPTLPHSLLLAVMLRVVPAMSNVREDSTWRARYTAMFEYAAARTCDDTEWPNIFSAWVFSGINAMNDAFRLLTNDKVQAPSTAYILFEVLARNPVVWRDEIEKCSEKLVDGMLAASSGGTANHFVDTLVSMLVNCNRVAKHLVEMGKLHQFLVRSKDALTAPNAPVCELLVALTAFDMNYAIATSELQKTFVIDFAYERLAEQPDYMMFLLRHGPDTDRVPRELAASVASFAKADTFSSNREQETTLLSAALHLLGASPSSAAELTENGNLMTLIQRFARDPRMRERPEFSRLVALLTDARPDLLDSLIATVYDPLLAQLHAALADSVEPALATLRAVRETRGRFDADTVSMLNARLKGVESLASAFLCHLSPVIVTAASRDSPAARHAMADILALCERVLLAVVTDNDGRLFSIPGLFSVLEKFSKHRGLELGGAASEFHVDAAFATKSQLLPNLLGVPYTLLAALVQYDELRGPILDLLPLMALAAARFKLDAPFAHFAAVSLHAPCDAQIALDGIAETMYRTAVASNSGSIPHPAVHEFLSRAIVRDAVLDAVHWADVTGNAPTGCRGTTILNSAHTMNTARASHGVVKGPNSGKFAFPVERSSAGVLLIGWTVHAGPLRGNDYSLALAGEDHDTYLVDFHAMHAIHAGKTRYLGGKPAAPLDTRPLVVTLDLETGEMSGAPALGKPLVVLFRGLDMSKTWYPVVVQRPNSCSAARFDLAPPKFTPVADAVARGTAVPVRPLAAVELSPPFPESLPLFASFGANPNSTFGSDWLYFSAYYETALVAARAPCTATGLRAASGAHYLWVAAANGVEYSVQFVVGHHPSLPPHGRASAVEDSVEWNEWVPAVAEFLATNPARPAGVAHQDPLIVTFALREGSDKPGKRAWVLSWASVGDATSNDIQGMFLVSSYVLPPTTPAAAQEPAQPVRMELGVAGGRPRLTRAQRNDPEKKALVETIFFLAVTKGHRGTMAPADLAIHFRIHSAAGDDEALIPVILGASSVSLNLRVTEDGSAAEGPLGRGNAKLARGPRSKFRKTHAAVGKLIVAMRATKVVPVPLFNKQVSQSSDIGSTESRAMISMILFKPFCAINELAPARGEEWSHTLDLFKNTQSKAKLEVLFRTVKFVLIDEISMVGAELFAAMHLRFDALYPSHDHRPFGGLHVLTSGDFLQFEPVMARSLTVPSEQLVERAPEPEWLAFDSAFFLVQQMRKSGDASFLNVLQDLRNCVVSLRLID
ncbi:hypothetical protein H9P43_009394 [Blastocladiella emersonii ATCC 22665]|nr:hypothetical protein H9P43_009394 [Blastocladiella emersonii ATCC 22665]